MHLVLRKKKKGDEVDLIYVKIAAVHLLQCTLSYCYIYPINVDDARINKNWATVIAVHAE